MDRKLVLYLPGLVPYKTAYGWQRAAAQQRISGDDTDVLIVLQHPPVVTLGRLADSANVLASRDTLESQGIEIVETDRGGDVTYHGPGQMVAYPVLNLERYWKDIGWYLRCLEDVVIRTINDFGITGDRIPGYTGVWVSDEKIAAIGVAVRKWVTYHGIAINIDLDLEFFKYIKPCGMEDVKITSLKKELDRGLDINETKYRLASAFREVSSLVKAAT